MLCYNKKNGCANKVHRRCAREADLEGDEDHLCCCHPCALESGLYDEMGWPYPSSHNPPCPNAMVGVSAYEAPEYYQNRWAKAGLRECKECGKLPMVHPSTQKCGSCGVPLHGDCGASVLFGGENRCLPCSYELGFPERSSSKAALGHMRNSRNFATM